MDDRMFLDHEDAAKIAKNKIYISISFQFTVTRFFMLIVTQSF